MSRCNVYVDDHGRSCVGLSRDTRRYDHLRKHVSHSTKQSKSKIKSCFEAHGLFICLFISATSILVSGTVVYLVTQKNVELSDDFCVPCDKIKFSPSPNENEKYRILKKDYENEIEICCASTPMEVDALLDLVAERKFKEEEIKELEAKSKDGYFKGSQISAHLLMIWNETSNGIELMTSRTLSHFNGVKVNNPTNRIIILTKGKYFVYSQVYFKVIKYLNEDKDTFTNKVMRYNMQLPNGGNTLLLRNHFTADYATDHDFRSVYSTGIFVLNPQDEIYVTINDASVISRSPEKNFIGLFLLEES